MKKVLVVSILAVSLMLFGIACQAEKAGGEAWMQCSILGNTIA